MLCDALMPGWKPPSVTIAAWQRRRGADTDFSVWDRGYDGVLLGLPRAREEWR
ncbi:MAG: hypothetical protein WDO70_07240 [Alphaproteobacteria bacterium]